MQTRADGLPSARTDGFCNFTSTDALLAFAKARLGTRWNLCGSDKLCVLSYANIQVRCPLPSLARLMRRKLRD